MSRFNLTGPKGDVYPIEGETLIGRGSQCSLRLDDSEASRSHARVYVDGGNLVVKDQGSANGTFVNNLKVGAPVSLSDGDEIRIGKTVFVVQITDAEDFTPTVFASEVVPIPEGVPAPEAVESTRISEDQPAVKKRSRLPFLLIGCGGLVLVTLCALVVVFVVSGVGVFQDLLGDLSFLPGGSGIIDYSLEQVLAEEVVDDRPGVLSYLGLPDAFTSSSITMEGVPVRVETWRYFAFEMRVDFVDGEATWTMDIEPAPDDSILPAWYDPLAFELGMSPSEVAFVAASASPAGQTPEAIDLSEGGEDLMGSTMLVGDQILIGLDPSGVVYVETIALFPEGEGGS